MQQVDVLVSKTHTQLQCMVQLRHNIMIEQTCVTCISTTILEREMLMISFSLLLRLAGSIDGVILD